MVGLAADVLVATVVVPVGVVAAPIVVMVTPATDIEFCCCCCCCEKRISFDLILRIHTSDDLLAVFFFINASSALVDALFCFLVRNHPIVLFVVEF